MMKISDPSIISECETSHDVEILFFPSLYILNIVTVLVLSWSVSRYFSQG